MLNPNLLSYNVHPLDLGAFGVTQNKSTASSPSLSPSPSPYDLPTVYKFLQGFSNPLFLWTYFVHISLEVWY